MKEVLEAVKNDRYGVGSEETSSIILGEMITFGEYLRGEFEEDPEKMEDMQL